MKNSGEYDDFYGGMHLTKPRVPSRSWTCPSFLTVFLVTIAIALGSILTTAYFAESHDENKHEAFGFPSSFLSSSDKDVIQKGIVIGGRWSLQGQIVLTPASAPLPNISRVFVTSPTIVLHVEPADTLFSLVIFFQQPGSEAPFESRICYRKNQPGVPANSPCSFQVNSNQSSVALIEIPRAFTTMDIIVHAEWDPVVEVNDENRDLTSKVVTWQFAVTRPPFPELPRLASSDRHATWFRQTAPE